MNLPSCNLELTDPASDWRSWLRALPDSDLASVKCKLAQFGLKAERAMLPQVESIERLAKDESALRFPEVVAKHEEAKTALAGAAELLTKQEERLLKMSDANSQLLVEIVSLAKRLEEMAQVLQFATVLVPLAECEAKLSAAQTDRDALRQHLHGVQ